MLMTIGKKSEQKNQYKMNLRVKAAKCNKLRMKVKFRIIKSSSNKVNNQRSVIL